MVRSAAKAAHLEPWPRLRAWAIGSPPHPFEHPLDMADRRRRQDAVAEIEDERALAELGEDVVHLAVERLAAGEQNPRIDIALHRHARLDFPPREVAVDLAFEADRIDAGLSHIARDILAGAARKTDDFGTRLFGAQFRHQPLGRLHRPALEFAQ